ncbi:MAG: ATP-binding protein [Gemmatimonadetes bacterium]|nr:ATP-binding protein [Gemmatimonadota bacterium]
MAFVRCLTQDVVDALARDSDGFCLPEWQIWRVADVGDDKSRTITADRAVEIRESKSEAVLLLVDTGRAGAGMDGIFSATREVAEADLFAQAHRLVAAAITRILTAGHRRYAERAVSRARGHGGRFAVSPWRVFDFYCHVADNKQPAGAYLHLLGLWPAKGTAGARSLSDIDASRKFVDRLLAPAVAGRTPAERIAGLRLLEPTEHQLRELEGFLREAATLPIRSALPRLVGKEHLWINALRTEEVAQEILSVELLPWRTKAGKVVRWSGLTDRAGDLPALFVDPDAEEAEPYAKLEVRWKARPEHLAKGSVEYRVVVETSGSGAEIASREELHSARAQEKHIFTQDDFPDLPEDAVIPAKVSLSVVGADSIETQESEEFEILCGERPAGASPVGKRFRTFSEALIELDRRADVEAMTAFSTTVPRNARGDYLIWSAPSRRGYFRVYRPPLVKEAEEEWRSAGGVIGRWRVKVRVSGKRVGRPEFLPFDCPAGADQQIWNRVQRANVRMSERFGDFGGVGQVYDDRVPAFKTTVSEYMRSWNALLQTGYSDLALAHTIEVQSQSGEVIGLVVLPSHPLRMAWHAAYDNLVLHARFDEELNSAEIRREMAALDGAMFPAFLPGFAPGRSFVFADTLGFHAVGMVADTDAEPKGTLAILHRALVTRDAEASGGVPTVGSRGADVLGNEIYKYLEAHEAVRVMHVHALRAGDGKTVVRALGLAAKRVANSRRGERMDDGAGGMRRLIYVLELHPSAGQRKRGVAGRFIAEAQEKRRRGAGTLDETDRWMLQSVSLPGGVRLPRLRWARKEVGHPETAAHIALAFDTFASRVCATEAPSAIRPVYAFGLMAFLERSYSSEPHPRWRGAVPDWEGGEGHPSLRAHTDRLLRTQDLVSALVARNLEPERSSSPVLVTEVSPESAEELDQLHELCDWVITLDRNAGIEYFDSPGHDRETYDRFVIDCVPEREDLGCLQLITSTASLEEVRGLLDVALSRMGLSHSRRNAEFLMTNLKALSGRLAIRLTGGTTPASELVALALSQANCHGPGDDECWASLAMGFFVPVDDIRDLLPPVVEDGGERSSGVRPDLVYVGLTARGGLSFRFVEVKYRRHLRAARSSQLLEDIRDQTRSMRRRWFSWYGLQGVARSFRAIRRGKLARILRFYADKASRHGLPDDRHQALVGEIDRMVERSGNYEFTSAVGGERGWVFCPEFRGRKPLKISPREWEDVGVFLFGPASLPDLDWNPPGRDDKDLLSESIKEGGRVPAAEGANQDTTEDQDPPVPDGGLTVPNTAPEGDDSSRDEAPTARLVFPITPASEPSLVMGQDRFADSDVNWSLTVKGNPHLLVAGLSGMGKTTCLLNLCKQMMVSGVRPIVFSYHEDIDEKLESIGQPVRFIDFDGLGFNPLEVFDRLSRFAHLDVAGTIRDIFMAVYPELGGLQGGDIRKAVKESFQEVGWGSETDDATTLKEPAFRRFLEILRDRPKPNVGLRNLLERLEELDDYGFFTLNESQGGMWDSDGATVIRIHRTQSDVLQRAFSSLVFYGLYKNMFRRGIRDRITHAIIMDEAHRAARLTLIPTMAKECRKYGISLVLASQEARDFHVSVFSAIANYLVLRLNEPDAKALVKNVASSTQQSGLVDKIKQMERFRAFYFSANRARPSHLDLPDFSPRI